jgi:hypothetical protein
VIGRLYFVRQAVTLLKFAKSTSNPNLAAVLIDKAAELSSQVDQSNLPEPTPSATDAKGHCEQPK